MKVKELIERLQSFDQELDVYIYNEKEHELNLVETANQTSDWGEGENGECDWEDFITIFPELESRPLFTLTDKQFGFLQGLLEELFEYSYFDGHAFDKVVAEDILHKLKQYNDGKESER